MRIILLGAPGAGKGTQSVLLSKKLNIPQISTGDIFRYNLKNETPLGKMAMEYMDKGLLVPDEITINIVQGRLKKDDCIKGFILDGFPRTLLQSKSLDKVLEEMGITLDCVINFDAADEVILKRLLGRRICPICGNTFHIEYDPPKEHGICDICHVALTQRVDDKEDTIIKRLIAYHEQTEPLIEYYQRRDILLIMDATKTIDVIALEITTGIENISYSNKVKTPIHKIFDLTVC